MNSRWVSQHLKPNRPGTRWFQPRRAGAAGWRRRLRGAAGGGARSRRPVAVTHSAQSGRAAREPVGWLWQPAAYNRLVVTTMRTDKRIAGRWAARGSNPEPMG